MRTSKAGFTIRSFVIARLCFCATLALAPAGAFAAELTPAGKPRFFKDAPGVEENYFEESRGDTAFDKIGLHHVCEASKPGENPAVVIVYLPGTNMNGEVAPPDVKHSFALYLASHGADFWAMDYRTHFVPPSTPESDLAPLRRWTNDLFESDIDEVVNFVRHATHRDRVFLAGFSRGVEFEYLYTALHPQNVEGLIVLDGFIPSRAQGAAPPEVSADDLGGRNLTFDKRKVLLDMVIANPDGPAPIPRYKSARENLEHVVYDSAGFGGRGGLANPQGGFSDPLVLAQLMVTYDRWWPAIQNYENPFTPERLAALKDSLVPVIAFASTNIAPDWPAKVRESAQSTGSGDVTFSKLEGRGHLDVLCGTRVDEVVFAPIDQWTNRHQARQHRK